MPWGAAFGAVLNNMAAGDAADAAAAGGQLGIGEQRRQFDTVRSDTAPYRDVGQGSLYRLADMFGISHPGSGLNPSEQQELSTLEGMSQASQRGGGFDEPGFLKAYYAHKGDASLYDREWNASLASASDPEAFKRWRLGEIMADAPQALKDQYQQAQPLTPEQSSRLEFLKGRVAQGNNPQPFNPNSILEKMPGYQFRLNEGTKALDRKQSKYRFTPRAAKELSRYTQDYASGEFGNAVESMFRLSGLGGSAVNSAANAGSNAANNISQIYGNIGNTQANAAIAGAAGTNNAIQGGLSNYYTLQAYNQNRPQTTPTTEFYGVGNAPY
jgi:hypothetical protein